MIIDIAEAFIERRQSLSVTDEALSRIAAAYEKSKMEQASAGSHYQVSREWLPIYSGYMQKIMTVLEQKDISGMRRLYENFFREDLSTGLHGMNFSMVEKYMTPDKLIAEADLRVYMENCIRYANLFLRSCRNVPVSVLERPAIGNPYGYRLDETMVYIGAEYHYYYAEKIRMLLQKMEHPIVMELGGGFGGMAYYLMRDVPHGTYIGVDLPENAALQAYYLMASFPDKKILLYGEEEIRDCDISKFDAIIIPNFAIETIFSDGVNLSFNSYSLAEMSLETIESYLKTICRVSSDYFYHVNHTVWEVNADLFPIDYEKFDLLFRFPTMWGKDPQQLVVDQHDFIYQRRCAN